MPRVFFYAAKDISDGCFVAFEDLDKVSFIEEERAGNAQFDISCSGYQKQSFNFGGTVDRQIFNQIAALICERENRHFR